MAFEHQTSSPQRLLPPSLEDRLLRTLARGLGAALCLMSAIGWASLLSWSVSDPSPMHVTGGVTRNWLGSTGAATADLLLQTLGVASLFALLAPMMWGVELWLAERLPSARLKLLLFPLSVLILAGGCSALPLLASWPLHRGLGGMLGDLTYNMLAGALGAINPSKGGAVAGLLYFTVGMAALTHCIGLSGRDLALLLHATPPPAFPDRRQGRRYVSWWGGWRRRKAQPEPEPPSLDMGPGDTGPVDLSDGGKATEAAYRRIWDDPTANNVSPTRAPEPRSSEPAASLPMHPVPQLPAAPQAGPSQPVWQPTPPWQPGIGARPVLPQMMPIQVPTHPAAPGTGTAHELRAPAPVPSTAPARAASRIAMHISFDSPHRATFKVDETPPVAIAAPVTGQSYDGPDRRSRPRDQVFEKSTESGSRSIAARFAPSSITPRSKTARHTTSSVAGQQGRKPGLLNSLTFRRGNTAHKRPSLNLLMRPSTAKPNQETAATHLRATAGLLEHSLADFGIDGRVIDMRTGPVVTEFVIEPAIGTKITRIMALADDIARAIHVPGVRILSHGSEQFVEPDGASALIGIEVPNARADMVLLRDVLDCDAYRSTEDTLPLALGRSTTGQPVVIDLATLPHLLVVGAPNTGIAVGLNAMLLSLLFRHAPEDCRLLLIDTSMVDFSAYNAIPHLLAPIISEPTRGLAALQWAVTEMSERTKRMALLGLQDISIYNNRVRDAKRRGEVLSRTVQTGFDSRTGLPIFEESPLTMEVMPTVVIMVDEFADLMLRDRRATEQAVQQLAVNARATGIHLIMATQRPSPDVLTPALRDAIPSRMAFKLTNKAESRLVLGEPGAEHLLGHGDMLLMVEIAGHHQMTRMRVHGAMVSPEEVESVAASVRAQGTPVYVPDLGEPSANLAPTNWGKVG
jgi:DNA segregation ATPase FtsK/SpoIIIE, S-DNA-T family